MIGRMAWLALGQFSLMMVTGGCSDLALVGDQARLAEVAEQVPTPGGGQGEVVDSGSPAGPPFGAMPHAPGGPPSDGGMACVLDGWCELTDDCDDPDCITCVQSTACPGQWPFCDEGYCVECLEDEDCGDWECDDGFCEPD